MKCLLTGDFGWRFPEDLRGNGLRWLIILVEVSGGLLLKQVRCFLIGDFGRGFQRISAHTFIHLFTYFF